MGLFFDPLIMTMKIGLIFIVLERLWPARLRPRASMQRYITDIAHAVIGSMLIRMGILGLGLMIFAWFEPTRLAADLPFAVQFVLVLLLCDLIVWLVHRSMHAVPLLWRLHRIHHSSEQLDWLATYRTHPIEQTATSLAVLIPPVLLGFSTEVIALYSLVYVWHVQLIHSNVRMPLGPLRHILTDNRFHHWHHADQADAYDRNFGAQLTVWDRLFGTAYRNSAAFPDAYGVDNPPPESFLAHLVAPFSGRQRRAIGGDPDSAHAA